MHSGNRTFRTNLSIKMLLNVCLLNVITLVFLGHCDCETGLSDKEIRPGTTDRPRPGCSPLCTKCWCYRIPCDQDQPPVVGVTGLFNSEEAIQEMIEDNTAASIAKSVPVRIDGKVFFLEFLMSIWNSICSFTDIWRWYLDTPMLCKLRCILVSACPIHNFSSSWYSYRNLIMLASTFP